jgi:hypothetical protein
MIDQLIDHPERVRTINSYLRSAACVCPFARICKTHYVVTSDVPSFEYAGIRQTMQAFAVAGEGPPDHAIVVVRAKDQGGFADTKQWAVNTFAVFVKASVLLTDPGFDQARLARHIDREVLTTITDESHRIRPHITLFHQPLITICLSPFYEKKHPRHAPHDILVITRHSDVRRAQKSKSLVTEIRRTMKREHGFVYDANDIVLPLPRRTRR